MRRAGRAYLGRLLSSTPALAEPSAALLVLRDTDIHARPVSRAGNHIANQSLHSPSAMRGDRHVPNAPRHGAQCDYPAPFSLPRRSAGSMPTSTTSTSYADSGATEITECQRRTRTAHATQPGASELLHTFMTLTIPTFSSEPYNADGMARQYRPAWFGAVLWECGPYWLYRRFTILPIAGDDRILPR